MKGLLVITDALPGTEHLIDLTNTDNAAERKRIMDRLHAMLDGFVEVNSWSVGPIEIETVAGLPRSIQVHPDLSSFWTQLNANGDPEDGDDGPTTA